MCSLLGLPDEMIHQVCTSLSDIHHASLFELVLVNKHLSRLVTPLLVRRWFVDPEKRKPPAIERLALHLLRHPGFRKEVKHVQFASVQTAAEHHDTTPLITSQELEQLSLAVHGAWPALAESTDWADQIRNGIKDALATLILCWTPNLTSFELSVPHFWPGQGPELLLLQFVGQVIRQFKSSGPHWALGALPLLELRSVTYSHWDTENTTEGKFAAPFFHLPKLKTFMGFKFGMGGYDGDEDDSLDHQQDDGSSSPSARHQYMTDFPIGTSTVEELIIYDADVTVDALSTLVRACRRLTVLDFELAGFLEHLEDSELRTNALAQVIMYHAETLKVLRLRFEQSLFVEYKEDLADGPVRFGDCFRQLQQLESLAIEPSFLYEHDSAQSQFSHEMVLNRLPPSLHHLRFETDAVALNDSTSSAKVDNWINSFQGLIKECRPDGLLPNLRHFDLRDMLIDKPGAESIVRLKTMAEDRGVRLGLQTLRVWEPPN
ncbi:hypothetical protein NM208_g6029 [Fusarium decemcellulare]|uniref:Uncharacterized protein n=2 Tax=Fusarium decemcellulare TaxID=57161 RepID=A0ACC1S6T1_9HYPO|nr:hypothetical protein NM208_g8033 [Fusarium decemcellulare]KAJ3538147.1 hypothetical protein NM208_g6029 [Fusarium decemcellulare]